MSQCFQVTHVTHILKSEQLQLLPSNNQIHINKGDERKIKQILAEDKKPLIMPNLDASDLGV